MMNHRRQVLLRGLGVLAATLTGGCGSLAAGNSARGYAVTRTEAEWKRLLTPDQFATLREGGTERAHTSPLSGEDRPGSYACAGCGQPLYSSAQKFYSETGWPSFWAPLPGAVEEVRDNTFGTLRTGINCSRCGGHHGHVFNDGPEPTGLRYCMNGLGLDFRPA